MRGAVVPNWITGKELMTYWDIEGFELFNCLGEGLQPYTVHGQKIVNIDTLDLGREKPIEWYINELKQRINIARGEQEVGHVITRSGGMRSSTENPLLSLTPLEIEQQAKKRFEKQPVEPIDPPLHHMSFTLPDDYVKAMIAILKVMGLKFRKDKASEYGEKHGYRSFNEDVGLSIPCKRHQENPDIRPPEPHGNSFILQGEYWSIHCEGSDEVNINNRERIRYIVRLIEKPHYSFSALELKRLVKGEWHESDTESENDKAQREKNCLAQGLGIEDPPSEELEYETKKLIEKTMHNSWDDVIAAKAANDKERIAKTQQEFNKAASCIYDAHNIKVTYSDKAPLFKFYPKTSKEASNTRSNVTIQINNAIRDFKKDLPELWKHLKTHIDTGTNVIYAPPVGFPKWVVRWNN